MNHDDTSLIKAVDGSEEKEEGTKVASSAGHAPQEVERNVGNLVDSMMGTSVRPSSSSSVSSHALDKICHSLTVIQNLVDATYVASEDATNIMEEDDEQELLCCVAMRLDEIVCKLLKTRRVRKGESSGDPSHLALLNKPAESTSSVSPKFARASLGDSVSLAAMKTNGDVLQTTPFLPTASTSSRGGRRPRLSRSASMSSLMGSQRLLSSSPLAEHGTVFDVLSSPSLSLSNQAVEEEAPLMVDAVNSSSSSSSLTPGARHNWNRPFSKLAKLQANMALREAALRVFDAIDKNKDGFLDRDEVNEALRQMELLDGSFKFTTDADPFDATDLNEDGKVDKKEFLRMVKIGALRIKTQGTTEKETSRAKAMLMSSRFASSFFLAPQNKNIETETIGADRWLIHPKSPVNVAWSGLISILILVVMITMPLSFGWQEFGDKLLIYNTVIDFLFQADIIKTFFTGMVDDDDSVLMDAKRIRSKYIKGYFVADVLSSLPLDLIFFLTEFQHGTTKNSLKLSKLMLLFKLLRFRRIRHVFDLRGALSSRLEAMLNIRINGGIAKITNLFLLTFIIAHWIGCFQFMLVEAFDYPEDSWIVYAGLENTPPIVQWSWSLFKALAQMILLGFETPPFTNGSCDTFTHWCQIEHWVTLTCLYGGAIFYSFLISFMLEIIQTTYYARRAFETKFSEIDGWMRANKMPHYLRVRVKNNFRAMHSGKFYDSAVLQVVGPKDLADIHRVQAEQLLNKIPCFLDLRNSHPGLLKDMACRMERIAMSKNERIFDEGSDGDTVFFIEHGLVELYLPSSDIPKYRVIGERCFFGEVSPLFGTARTTSARVKQDCVLYQIASDDFMGVLCKYPEARKTLKQVAYERINRVQCYRNPAPEDLASAKEDDIDTQDARVAQ